MFQINGFNSSFLKKVFFLILIIFLAAGFHFETFAQNQPQTPVMDSISITADGHPIIAWEANNDNTIGYFIYRRTFDGSFFRYEEIDSVPGINSTSYIDYEVSGCNESQWYSVRADAGPGFVDSGWSDTLRTIYLEQPVQNICANTISLQWTDYINMVSQLEGYRILASEDGGAFYELATVPPGQTNYTHNNPAPGVSYRYKIRAFNEDGSRTSTSCKQTITTRTYQKPSFAHLLFATVEDDAHIRLEWITDDAPISKFEILRSDDGGSFSVINEIEDVSTFNPDNFYIDNSADFNARSYYYRINVCDSCGITLFNTGNLTRTIHLTGAPGAGFVNNLQWNEYMGWDLGIATYRVWRQIEGDPASLAMIAELPAGTSDYQDDVSSLGNLEGSFVYYIEALENDGDNGFEDFPDISLSNRVTISQETSVLLPNAFIPGGLPPDNEFKPVASFIEQENYQMIIFNKWGQQIFSSTEISTGWDGTHNGEVVPGGAYVYVIRFRNAEGQSDELHGTVTVVR
jgi:gliding motility-associated-like protein